MDEFTEELQSLKPSFTKMNPNLELISNQSTLENFDSTDHRFMAFSTSTFLDPQQSRLPMNFTGDFGHERKNEKVIPAGLESFMNLSPPPVSGTGLSGNDESLGIRRKWKRKNEEKPKDVVHVRARRGQATDSHSLAERVRREKINERLRCLQDLVPGCYKTMGMAVMLDVVINYVQSLQNQIEFLSMKLSAASMYYDLNLLEMDSVEALQGANASDHQVQEMESILTEGNGGPNTHFNSTWSL